MKARRVVTGHDTNGKAVILSDEVVSGPPQMAAGIEALTLWSTRGFPANNDGDRDTSGDVPGMTMPGGTVFAMVSFAPGCVEFPHRTNSIDYGVIVAGEIDMALEDGQRVHLKAGDVVVQRGSIHTWINTGSETCILAASIIDAEPAKAGSKVLEATV
ncbi:MAG TPA: cupin domain-containing protein [Dehalococcoidia bacterium]|nr:cupin domain-containing protein [Dehalococcoidia bacterium]